MPGGGRTRLGRLSRGVALAREAGARHIRPSSVVRPVSAEPTLPIHHFPRPASAMRAIGVAIVVTISFVVALPPAALAAQSFRGSTLSTAGGLVLGGYSGAMFGLVGTLMPCNRTTVGNRCAASGASTGAALGLTMGGLIGAQHQDAIVARFESAGYGALVGAAVGVGLRSAVRQYQWGDVLAVTAIGAAVGAAPEGVLLGAGGGAAVGSVVWLLFDRAGFPDFIMFTVGGAALGGMIDWAEGASRVRRDERPIFTSSFSLQVR